MKKALQQDVDLAQAFFAVNKLFTEKAKLADDVMKADVDAAKMTVQVYNLANLKGKAVIEKCLALAEKLAATLPEAVEETSDEKATLSKEETSEKKMLLMQNRLKHNPIVKQQQMKM